MNDNLTWSLRMCSVRAWKNNNNNNNNNVSISSNYKCCIEGGLINFNYKRNLTSRIILAFFPSLVAIVLSHNHLVGPGVEGRKVTSHLVVWGFIPSHFLSFSSFLFWPATLQPLALVVSPRLGLRHRSRYIIWIM